MYQYLPSNMAAMTSHVIMVYTLQLFKAGRLEEATLVAAHSPKVSI